MVRPNLNQIIMVLLLAAACQRASFSSPFKPRSGDEILERLPARSVIAPNARRGAIETNVVVVAKRVEEHIQAYREESDPRYLGYAQALLKPWWETDGAPANLLLLRATIKQSLHNFTGALSDLDLVLEAEPRNAQAWLTRATILQVQGKPLEAKKAAAMLLQIAPRHIAATAMASAASLNGDAQPSYVLLSAALRHAKNAPAEERLWASTILAEIAARTGQSKQAETHFQEALAIDRTDTYLLAAYADFLMDSERHAEAASLLENQGRADALLLRRAIARKVVKSPEALGDKLQMAARFKAARLRGDNSHSREEARFTLELLEEPPTALKLAQLNWETQKEPADARLLMEAALASMDRPAAAPVVEWLKSTGLEDTRLAALQKRLND